MFIGDGFNSTGKGRQFLKKPDSNGKQYSRFYLIEDGVNRGLYAPILVTKMSGLRDEVLAAEMKDIVDSGYEILSCDND
ncbi:hypothetical protein L1D14_23100 [Vibrio tubiashii]|uniref:hypothetical protein n=1 Tax=Vibrio tubiashii TaxID=29498 RepID=UPI001EFD2F17|nr:hypothetical protein [Vibrio tubiashii]MCG9579093.1 hypothetical protein [Vibrio tubiashii]